MTAVWTGFTTTAAAFRLQVRLKPLLNVLQRQQLLGVPVAGLYQFAIARQATLNVAVMGNAVRSARSCHREGNSHTGA